MNTFGNFDDDDEDYTNVASNRLASIFKTDSGKSTTSDQTKASKQQKQQSSKKETSPSTAAVAADAQLVAGVAFFANIQLFKYTNNAYESQGRAGLALLSNTLNNQLVSYRLLVYVTKTQPIASVKVTPNFKVIIQANNYSSFYDETNQPWSVMFENDTLPVQFATQITLAKVNLMHLAGTYDANKAIVQDLKVTNDQLAVESSDSIEVTTLITHWKDMKLDEVLENTQSKPFKVKLGKNKLPVAVEESLLNLKQGTRRLIVLQGSKLQPLFTNVPLNAIFFYDVTVQRVKKHSSKESADEQLNTSTLSDDSSRQRSDSVKDKAKALEQIEEGSGSGGGSIKSEKSKLISRMAKMGKPMLPLSGAVIANIESDDDDHQQAVKYQLPSQQQQQQQYQMPIQAQAAPMVQQQQHNNPQAQYQAFQQPQPQFQTVFTNPVDLYQQQQQFQQQQQQMLNANQLAIYKPVSQQLMPQLVQPTAPQQQQQLVEDITQQRQQTILVKLDSLNEKLEQMKTLQQQNSTGTSVPNMETTILLSNLQRIIKENEQYKKDLYEKSTKIEELNAKITDHLARNQSYIEKSHLLLEQKNSSYSDASEKNVMRILELEQDKMKLTQELTQLTGKISELNMQVNKQNMTEYELKQRFNEISKSYDLEKNEIERLKVDNLELKSKLDTSIDEFKKERQHKKQIELEMSKLVEEKHEFRDQLSNYEKLLNEKRSKYEADKKQLERDMEDTKQQYTSEISDLKERLNKYRANTNEMNKESVKQLEVDLTNEWKMKLDKALKTQEQKYERSIEELNVEKDALAKQLAIINEQFKTQREKLNQVEIANEQLNERVDELSLIDEKFKRLQSQALVMKERYEARIKELLDAEPDSEVLNEHVKKCMNIIFQKLKMQISMKSSYMGEGVLAATLKTIKFVTIQLMRQKDDDTENEEEVDYFSDYIVDADEKLDEQREEYEKKIQQLKEEFNAREQLMGLQYEARLKVAESVSRIVQREESPPPVRVVPVESKIEVEAAVQQVEQQVVVQNVLPDLEPVEIVKEEEEAKEQVEEVDIVNEEQQVEIASEVVEEQQQEEEKQEEEVEQIVTEKIEVINTNEHIEEEKQEEDVQETVPRVVEQEEKQQQQQQQEAKRVDEPKVGLDEVPSPEPLSSENQDDSGDNYRSIYDDSPEKDSAPVATETTEIIEVSSQAEEKRKVDLFDNVDDDDEDSDLFKPKPPNIDISEEPPKQVKKKSLFDDDDEDEDLFLFSNANKPASKPNSRSNTTISETKATEQTFPISSSSFEPPPLLDNNDDAKDDDIDWFK